MKAMFIDCISDDLAYIQNFYSSFIKGKTLFAETLFVPFLCRSLITASISEVENFLTYSESDYIEANKINSAVESFLKPPKPSEYSSSSDYFDCLLSNIELFYTFLESKNVHQFITKEQVKVFLAMKIIRNSIIHQSWTNINLKENKQSFETEGRKKYVESVGLPVDFMKFAHVHWDLILSTRESLSIALHLGALKGNQVL